MTTTVLMLQLASTLAMVGLIWFVQVVHYPLFGLVSPLSFLEYERQHQRLTTWVVAPLMLTEAATAVLLIWFRLESISQLAVVAGLLMLGIVWGTTFFWQVPAHQKLATGFDAAVHRTLVQSNWARTITWTLRGVLVCWMVAGSF